MKKLEDKVIDEHDCMELRDGIMTMFSENQRAAQHQCLTLPGQRNERKRVRIGTAWDSSETIDWSIIRSISSDDQFQSKSVSEMMMAQTEPFSRDGLDECEGERCLEVNADVDNDFWDKLVTIEPIALKPTLQTFEVETRSSFNW